MGSGLARGAPSREFGRTARMDTKRVHFIRIAGVVRGPLAGEDLRDLAEAGIVTPETEAATGAGGPWAGLATLAIWAEVFPARRVLGFKATEFVEVNRGSVAAAVDVNNEIAHANRPAAALRGREVVVKPSVRRGPREGEPLNEVQVIVQDVGRVVAEHTPLVPLPPAVAFPRWRWFAVPSGIGSVGLLCIPLLYDGRYDSLTVSIISGWVVLWNGLLLGVMVADRKFSATVRRNKSKLEQPK